MDRIRVWNGELDARYIAPVDVHAIGGYPVKVERGTHSGAPFWFSRIAFAFSKHNANAGLSSTLAFALQASARNAWQRRPSPGPSPQPGSKDHFTLKSQYELYRRQVDGTEERNRFDNA